MASLFAKYGTVVWFDFQVHEAGSRKGLPRGVCLAEYSSRKEVDTAKASLHGHSLHGARLQARYIAEEWFYGSGVGEPREAASSSAPGAEQGGAREYKTNAERFAEANRAVERERAREAEQKRLNLARLEARTRAIQEKIRELEGRL